MKLIDVCELIVDCPHSTAKDEGQGIPLVRTPNIGKGRLELSGVHIVSEAVYNQRIERAVPKAGDLILAREAPVGNVALIMPGQKVCLGQRVVLIRPDKVKADAAYLTYYLLSEEVQHRLKNSANGAVVAHLNMNEIRNLVIDLPEISIQKRIATILSSLDDKIALNNSINHNLEEQARIQFEAWCAKCVESKLIRELSSNILDYTPNNHKKVILLNSSDVTEGRFESLPFVDNQNLKGQFKKRFMKGDILYSEIRPRNHHFAICYFDADEYIASTRLMVIRKNEKEISSDALLYQYLLMPSVLEEFTSKTESRSGTFPQGNYDDLSSSEVPYSSDNLQIGKALDAIYGVIWANMEENKRLASIRDSLLPQLMSGLITC